MKKIITLFARDHQGKHLVYDELTPGAEWVIAGEGVATEKIDGTACMVRDGKFYKRYDAKRGKQKPPGFEPAQQEPDPITGHWPGWVPVSPTAPEDKYHRETFAAVEGLASNWTYELVGPKVQGNPYGWGTHWLLPHGSRILSPGPPDTFEGLRQYLDSIHIEGIVWWRNPLDEDCEKVKIKARDFGIPWPRPRKEP